MAASSSLYALTVFNKGDLEGSTGLSVIHKKHPEVFIPSGIMERGNYSAAAGFGFAADKFGVFSTFSAFLEMVIPEITMTRHRVINDRNNVLSHFSCLPNTTSQLF